MYGEMLWYAANDAAEDVMRMTPPPLSRRGLTACLAHRKGPVRLTPMTSSQASIGKSSNASSSPPITVGTPPRETMPALAHMMSSFPKRSSAVATVRATSASTVVSASTATAGRSRSSRSFTVASARSPRTSIATTFAPSAANSWAASRPRPEPAPVMIATLPSSLPMVTSAAFV